MRRRERGAAFLPAAAERDAIASFRLGMSGRLADYGWLDAVTPTAQVGGSANGTRGTGWELGAGLPKSLEADAGRRLAVGFLHAALVLAVMAAAGGQHGFGSGEDGGRDQRNADRDENQYRLQPPHE